MALRKHYVLRWDMTIGIYNNRKTHGDEVSEFFLDNVQVCPNGFGS